MTWCGRMLALTALVSLLGGCSVAGRLHFGDVTLGLHQGFAAIGSHVGVFVQ